MKKVLALDLRDQQALSEQLFKKNKSMKNINYGIKGQCLDMRDHKKEDLDNSTK